MLHYVYDGNTQTFTELYIVTLRNNVLSYPKRIQHYMAQGHLAKDNLQIKFFKLD